MAHEPVDTLLDLGRLPAILELSADLVLDEIRNSDETGLLIQGLEDGLPDPVGRISRKPQATTGVLIRS